MTRLTAVVVAPALSRQKLMQELRQRIDPAFLPRPLVFVEALPRNALGKLPRDALLRLARGESLNERGKPRSLCFAEGASYRRWAFSRQSR